MCVHVWVCIRIRVFVYVQMYIDTCRIYTNLLGPIPNNHILLVKDLANLSGSLHSDKKLSSFKMICYHLEVGKHGTALCVYSPVFALILASSEALISMEWRDPSLWYKGIFVL